MVPEVVGKHKGVVKNGELETADSQKSITQLQEYNGVKTQKSTT